MKVSTFHEIVKRKKKSLIKEYMSMTNKDFMLKYSVGATIVNFYFGGMKKGAYNADTSWKQEMAEKLVKKNKPLGKKAIVERTENIFRIVSILLKNYTEEEITRGKFILY